jgi:DNA-binding MarR family transcriptional regulator
MILLQRSNFRNIIQTVNDCTDGFPLSPPLPVGCQSRLGLLLARLGAALLDSAAEGLAPAGLDGRAYSVLAVLSDDEPRSQQDLAQMLGKAPALMVAVTDELEAQGLVARARDTSDRRRTRVTLTPAGQKALRHGDELVERMVSQLLAGLDLDGRERLHELLREGISAAQATA